ncbi:MAG: hypothetical protein HKO71_01695, partial [Pseudomonadales bacterium]|nr:hypothetical protein [Pseudomonadales bacterium]
NNALQLLFEQIANSSEREGNWSSVSNISLTPYLGQRVSLLLEAADEATGSLVEAGIDNIRIYHDPLDTDADGIVNNIDNCPTAANNNQLDTDGDTLGNVCDTDDDNDNLPDSEEQQLGTNTLLADTDFDGLNDYDEVYTHNTNPLAADSDGDGYSDAEEIAVGRNPNSFDAQIPLPVWALAALAIVLVTTLKLRSGSFR